MIGMDAQGAAEAQAKSVVAAETPPIRFDAVSLSALEAVHKFLGQHPHALDVTQKITLGKGGTLHQAWQALQTEAAGKPRFRRGATQENAQHKPSARPRGNLSTRGRRYMLKVRP
jgi:hypothetical protein